MIVKTIYDNGKLFQIQDGCQIDFDRFCNDSGSDYIQKVQRPKNDRTM